jgi:hypothetical protein
MTGHAPCKNFANTSLRQSRLQSPKSPLNALRVVVVLLSAGGTTSTSSRTRVPLSTTLRILLRSHRTRSSLSGIRNSSHRRLGRSSSGGSSSRLSSGDRRGSRRGSAVPELRSNAGVRSEATVDVEENTGVGGLVCAGERNAGGEGQGAGATDLDVDALHVELGAALPVALVKSEDLRAQNVLAGCEGGHFHGVLALLARVATCKELVDGPFAARVCVFGDLGPGLGGSGFAGVDHDGTLMGLDEVLVTRKGSVEGHEGLTEAMISSPALLVS